MADSVNVVLKSVFTILTVIVTFAAVRSPLSAQDNWPQFRGPDGQGHSTAKNLPLNFDDKTNVTWKTPIPGRGLSSPVVWGNQIWLTTALDEGHSLHALCLEKSSGSVLHDIEVFTNKETIKVNTKNSHASPSSVIEEGRVYVHYGTYGSACLDTQTGKKIWENRDLKLDHQEGPGSSPVIFENLFIVNCDGTNVRYVVALDKFTGQIVWKKERPGKPNPVGDVNKSFCTPTLIQVDGQWQMIDPGAKFVVNYDPHNGKELWYANYSGSNVHSGFSVVPRPITGFGMTFICSGYMQPELWAIKLGGSGDITQSPNIVWKVKNSIPANPSLLLVGEEIYLVNDSGIMSCLEAKTGKLIWRQRLSDKFWASPLFASGRIYFWGESGKVYVIAPEKKYKLLVQNDMGEGIQATPAVTGEALILRTEHHLYRIEQK